MDAVAAFREGVVARLHKGLTGLLEHAGITLVAGEGRLLRDRAVAVGDDTYQGRNVVLATGSYARTISGWTTEDGVITSDEALRLPYVPGRVLIVGGSVIGVEFASMWRSLGADVTVVEALPRLVPAEEPSISKQLQRAFRKRGIKTHLATQVQAVKRTDVNLEVELGNGHVESADVVLVAVGRGPSTAGLGLHDAGIVTENGWVTVDETLRTSVSGVYAVGDLVPGPQLAHRGFAHGIFVAEHIAGLEPELVPDSGIPRVTYCDPEIASVGLTEEQARGRYTDVETYEYNLGGNGKSQILGTAGFVKLVRRRGGEVLGAHMIGARVGEQVGEAALLVNTAAVLETVAQFVHAHPTQNEALGEALLAISGKPLHAHA